MANTQAQNKVKNLSKFLLALLVIFILWALFNDSTYNALKRRVTKDGEKYTEMYAYSLTKGSGTEKYFVKQDNSGALSFFENINVIDEDALNSIKCSKEEIILIYEERSEKISEYIKERAGEELRLNPETNIEFYVGKIINSSESCQVGDK